MMCRVLPIQVMSDVSGRRESWLVVRRQAGKAGGLSLTPSRASCLEGRDTLHACPIWRPCAHATMQS